MISLLFLRSTYAVFLLLSPLCLKIFWASFLITFLSPEIAVSIVRHVPFSLSRIVDVRFIVRDGAVSLNLLK